MKREQTAGLLRPAGTVIPGNPRAHVYLWAAHSVAICALLAQGVNPAQAADALPGGQPASQAAPAPKPAYAPHAYQMERYKAFARQAEMPAITATDKTSLEVGGTVKTDLKRLAQVSSTEKEALASPFGVPPEVIGKVLEQALRNSPLEAAQLARDIRTAVVDYRFLQQEWARYHPPLAGQKSKTDALAALQAGELVKAWELYDGLRKPPPPGLGAPPPPTGLRVVSHQ